MSISKKSRTKIKNTGTFLVFAGPSLFFFVMTILVPLVYGVYLTFTDWNGISREKNIVGLENYIKAFGDVKFWQSLLFLEGCWWLLANPWILDSFQSPGCLTQSWPWLH